ncbi:hypothetical protein CYY_007656 [Polysphondylium violaceum]|uniref:Tetratricopeptide-like helical domain-containing protein n=1 Tax=Polysphondylium violaceum TaxID=133409 RepID=A0A8J4PN89_9MYCE|nr:hypothetical protein CYY_007656 [Polysphondylium violaceum]
MNSIQRLTRFKYRSRLPISNHVTTNNFTLKSNHSNNKNIKTKIFSTINNNNYGCKYYFTSSKSLFSEQQQKPQQQHEIDVKYQSLIENAVEHFKIKEINFAIQLLDQAIQLCGNKPDAYLLRADIKSEFLRTFPSALHQDAIINDYETAVNLVPQNKKAYVYRAIAKYFGKLPETPLEQMNLYLDKAIELDPDNIDYVVDKVKRAGFLCRIEFLIEPSKRLVKERSKYGALALGLIAFAQGNIPQAIQLIQSVIDSEVNLPKHDQFKDVPLYHGRLIVGRDTQGYTRIRDRYYEANNILFDAYIYHAIVSCLHDPNLSLEYHKKALEIVPYAYHFHCMMGQMTFNSGRFEEAIKHCNNFFQHDPDFHSPYAHQTLTIRGCSYYQIGAIDKAYEDLQISLERNSTEKYTIDNILDRANPILTMIYCLRLFVEGLRGLDKSKFNIEAVIKSIDFDGVLLTEPKNIQQLFTRTRIWYNVYKIIIDESVQSGLVKSSGEEAASLYYRERLFYHLTDYLIDSMYLNYLENCRDIAFDDKDFSKLLDFISQLPYKESKQLPERQEGHKILLNLYKAVIAHIQGKDF